MEDLHQLLANLLFAIRRTDKSLAALEADRVAIQAKYEPVKLARSQFDSWRDSHHGKNFKQRLYKKQKGLCANPNGQMKGTVLPIAYLDIDHKLPIKSHPKLALTRSNMHLLCTPCNRKKNSKLN